MFVTLNLQKHISQDRDNGYISYLVYRFFRQRKPYGIAIVEVKRSAEVTIGVRIRKYSKLFVKRIPQKSNNVGCHTCQGETPNLVQ